ncbi:MAG: sugar phosphate isomerase/epimerase family protein [Candidatus Thermoplasmatota archaeon]
MKRKILASNPKFCLMPFNEALLKVEEEFEGWEILAEKYHGWEYKDDIIDAASTTDITLQLHAPLNDINIASINQSIRRASVKEIKKSLRLASKVGADLVTVHPGLYSPLGRYCDNVLELSKRSLEELKSEAEDLDVQIAIENLPEMWLTLSNEPEEMRELTTELGLNFCLDIGHAYTSDNLEDFLETSLVPANVHLHDNVGEEDIHLPLGKGEIDWKQVIKSLDHYEGNFVIEGRKMQELVESKKLLKKLINDQ